MKTTSILIAAMSAAFANIAVPALRAEDAKEPGKAVKTEEKKEYLDRQKYRQ